MTARARRDGGLGFGLVGCGGIGGVHAGVLSASPLTRLVAVADEVEASARALGERFGVPWFTDRRRLLEDREVEAVSVATPSGAHGEVGIEAARAGRHVITEKPLEVTLAKADALIAACREHGVRLGVISQFRFHEGMRAIAEAAARGSFGRLVLAQASTKWHRAPEYYAKVPWRGTWALDGGGSLMNQGIHAVDLMLSVMGPVRRVVGYSGALVHRIETEDASAAALEFSSGALGVIETATCVFPERPARVEVMGGKGSAIWELGGAMKLWAPHGGEPVPGMPDGVPWETCHRRQFEEFAAAVREKRDPAVSGADGRRAVEVIAAVYRSARERRPVVLGEGTGS